MKKVIFSLMLVLFGSQVVSAELPFSPYRVAGDTVYLSGQIALKAERGEKPTIQKETRIVLDKIKMLLTKEGLNLSNVVKATVYLEDIKAYSEMNKVYAGYFSKPYPARVALAVKELPLGAQIEISVIAHK